MSEERAVGCRALPIYLSGLERAKFELERAEKSFLAAADPLDKLRWSLDADVRRVLVRMYDSLVKLVQEQNPE